MAAKTQNTELTEDIIFGQILPRIPAKSLVELKCVCRKWYSTISSRDFAKTYLHHPFSLSSRSVLSLDYSLVFAILDYGDPNNLVLTRFNFNSRLPFMWLCASCNGLAFIISSPLESDHHPEFHQLPDHLRHFPFEYVVFNPALGLHSFVEVPHPPEFSLTTDDSYNFGFGYVSSSSVDDYFIVVINLINSEIVVYVYSCKSQQWRTPLNFKKPNGQLMEFENSWYCKVGTLVKETLHWGVTLGRDQKSIAAFDLATQNDIKLMQLPYPNFGNSGTPYDSDFNMGCIDGCLCAWARYNDVVEMWMMRDYGKPESWTKLFRFDPGFCCRDFFGFTESKMGLIFTADTEELLLADFGCDPPEYKRIEVKDKVQAVDYVPSLESPFPSKNIDK